MNCRLRVELAGSNVALLLAALFCLTAAVSCYVNDWSDEESPGLSGSKYAHTCSEMVHRLDNCGIEITQDNGDVMPDQELYDHCTDDPAYFHSCDLGKCITGNWNDCDAMFDCIDANYG